MYIICCIMSCMDNGVRSPNESSISYLLQLLLSVPQSSSLPSHPIQDHLPPTAEGHRPHTGAGADHHHHIVDNALMRPTICGLLPPTVHGDCGLLAKGYLPRMPLTVITNSKQVKAGTVLSGDLLHRQDEGPMIEQPNLQRCRQTPLNWIRTVKSVLLQLPRRRTRTKKQMSLHVPGLPSMVAEASL